MNWKHCLEQEQTVTGLNSRNLIMGISFKNCLKKNPPGKVYILKNQQLKNAYILEFRCFNFLNYSFTKKLHNKSINVSFQSLKVYQERNKIFPKLVKQLFKDYHLNFFRVIFPIYFCFIEGIKEYRDIFTCKMLLNVFLYISWIGFILNTILRLHFSGKILVDFFRLYLWKEFRCLSMPYNFMTTIKPHVPFLSKSICCQSGTKYSYTADFSDPQFLPHLWYSLRVWSITVPHWKKTCFHPSIV